MLDLQDCYLKLERARRHIADLENAQANYVGTEPYKGVAEYDPHVNMTFFVLRELPEIPRGISLYVGDAAHNLRTALDYLACALVVQNRNIPKNVYFPIAETAAKYDSESPAKTRGMSADAKKLIDDLHPHGDGNDWFYALHQLDIIDKHRLLPTVAISIGNWSVGLTQKPTIVGFNFAHNRNQPFGLRAGHFIGTMNGNHVDRQMSASVRIAFGEPAILTGQPVVDALKALAAMVESVLKFFETRFGAASVGQSGSQR